MECYFVKFPDSIHLIKKYRSYLVYSDMTMQYEFIVFNISYI